MNILLIGNGFDLAHELPTNYLSCLHFLKMFRLLSDDIVKDNFELFERHLQFFHFHHEIEGYLKNTFVPQNRSSEAIELIERTKDNIWLSCFERKFIYGSGCGETWIDFEKAISCCIQALQSGFNAYQCNPKENIYNIVCRSEKEMYTLLSNIGLISPNVTPHSFSRIIAKLIDDLTSFIRCLEIYFCVCLEAVTINTKLQDIKRIGRIDKVLSFNYTNTYERIYETDLGVPEYCYIHGKALSANCLETNNMVLGIDEYLDTTARSEQTEFVQFKKYYQRIFKQTDYNYINWFKDSERKNLYIFGHSLNITDKDVLEYLLLQPNVHSTIFYKDKVKNGTQIANLVKVLNYKRLNTLTRGGDTNNCAITFTQQLN